MPKRAFVDAHHHLWDLGANAYPWLRGPQFHQPVLGDIRPIAENYLLADFLLEARSVILKKSVHVETGWAGDPVGETEWLQSVADAHGFPHAIVAHAELERPDVEGTLAAHSKFRNVRGIRQSLNWHPDPALSFHSRSDLLTDAAWRRGYACLRKYGFGFDLQIYPWQMLDAAALAAENPETLVMLNHTGMPIHQHGAGFETWQHGMRVLAAQPNVAVKISGLGMLDWRWTAESVRDIVLETIDHFGTDRCMFASNFPVDRLYSSYDILFESLEEILSGFSELDKQKLFESNAERLYRI